MNFSNMRVGTRLGAGFALLGLLVLVVAGVGAWSAETQYRGAREVIDRDLGLAARSMSIRESLLGLRRFEKDSFINIGDSEKVKAYGAKWNEQMRATRVALAEAGKLVVSPEETRLATSIGDALVQYQAGYESVLAGIAAGDIRATADANAAIDKFKAAAHSMEKSSGELAAAAERRASAALQGLEQRKSRDLTVSGLTTAAVLVLAGVVAFLLTRSITRPLTEAVAVAEAVAGGDLTRSIVVRSTDETGQLLAALQRMNERLGAVIGQIRESTDAVGTAAKEIAQGNTDLSQRTEEQASSLEETASSMEELTATVKQNADNARQANQLAASASGVAVKGGAVVGEVVSTMGAISDSSKRIADIISVIDGIAFQTNILALNAAVEAARAGEQGRGFAVVASEVRSLAQRSAAAAKEIKLLITDAAGKVDSGSKLVEDAGQTMAEVVASVKRVTDIMAEITAASLEQSTGIEQVNEAIVQMDQVTQQNAALVEESAAAAESMEEQARQLAEAVSVFKLAGAAASDPAQAAIERARAAAKEKPAAPPAPRAAGKPVPKAAPKPAATAKAATDDEWAEF